MVKTAQIEHSNAPSFVEAYFVVKYFLKNCNVVPVPIN